MLTISAERMREIDRRCIKELGIPGAVLMNNAGAAVYARLGEGAVAVVCGKGNNGGDGFVVARLALVAGREVTVVLLAEPHEIGGDARVFLEVYQKLGGRLLVASTPEQVVERFAAIPAAIWVDAMLGTGARGALREPYLTAVRSWPKGLRTVAVDLPSGLDADTGEVVTDAVRASCTVTLHAAKPGFSVSAAAPYLGTLHVADIGIPAVCHDDAAWAQLKSAWA